MLTTLETIADLSHTSEGDPYIPYPAAVETGILAEPESLASPLDTPAGVIIANGYIPNAAHAGLVEFGNEIIAYDHAGLEIEGDKLYINPTSKEDVSHAGRIVGEGVIIQERGGMLKIAALAINTAKRPWLADRLNTRGLWYPTSEITVFSAGPFDFPVYEITEINLTTGALVTQIAKRYF